MKTKIVYQLHGYTELHSITLKYITLIDAIEYLKKELELSNNTINQLCFLFIEQI